MADFKLNGVGSSGTRRRPKITTNAFGKLCDWLENSDEIEFYSIQELHDRMVTDNDGAAYTLKSFREKSKTKYKDRVYFVKGVGYKSELVCFKETPDYTFTQLKYQGSEKKEKVVKVSAKITKEEIREMNFSKDFYLSVHEIKFSKEGEKWGTKVN